MISACHSTTIFRAINRPLNGFVGDSGSTDFDRHGQCSDLPAVWLLRSSFRLLTTRDGGDSGENEANQVPHGCNSSLDHGQSVRILSTTAGQVKAREMLRRETVQVVGHAIYGLDFMAVRSRKRSQKTSACHSCVVLCRLAAIILVTVLYRFGNEHSYPNWVATLDTIHGRHNLICPHLAPRYHPRVV